MDKELQKHCIIECRYGDMFTSIKHINEGIKSLLNESGGIMNGIDRYIAELEEKVETDLKDKETGTYHLTYDETTFSFETFFDTCEIVIDVHLGNMVSRSITGGYRAGVSGWKENDNYFVSINLVLWGNLKMVLNKLRVVFAHELTHAYEDYCRKRIVKRKGEFRQSGDDIYTSSTKRGIYRAIAKDNISAEDIESLYDLIYYTSSTEINGYVGQMREELRQYFKEKPPMNTQEIFNAIKHTQAYSVIKNYEDEVKMLVYIAKSNDESLNEIKNNIVETYNKINRHDAVEKNIYKLTDKPLTTINQVVKIIVRKFKRLKMRFYSHAPRIAYDTYMEQFNI